MPLGAFHYAFASRDELLGAVIVAVADLDRIAAEPALDAPGTGPDALRDLLSDGIGRYVDHLESDPYAELAFLELMLHGARQDLDEATTQRRYDATYATPEDLLARAASACGQEWSVPLSHAARLLVNALDGMTIAYLADHDADAARASAAFHADALSRLARPANTITDQEN